MSNEERSYYVAGIFLVESVSIEIYSGAKLVLKLQVCWVR